MPRLEELLDLAAGKVGFALEIKTPGIEEEVIENVEKWGIEDEVIIISGHWVVLSKVKSPNPRITTLADLPLPSKLPSKESLRAALSHGRTSCQYTRPCLKGTSSDTPIGGAYW